MPLAVMLGGSLGRVPAYNSNGLWLTDVSTLAKEARELVAEGQFKGLKLRLGRDGRQADLAALRAVRDGAGDEIKLMVDFNQGLSAGRSADSRCHALDDQGALLRSRNQSPTTTCRATRSWRVNYQTPVQIGKKLLRAARHP